jgi:hypothetical protein
MVALGYGLDAGEQRQDHNQYEHDGEDVKAENHGSALSVPVKNVASTGWARKCR